MIEVTELAHDRLQEYLAQNNISSPIRLMLMQGGCSGSALGLAIDEPQENDEVVTLKDLTFLIEDSLLQQLGEISIDYTDAGARTGFSITSSNPIEGGGCSSGSCGSGGCGC
jgi:iron-sulfur cluster assembly accessory protein